MEERNELMRSAPPKIIEKALSLLIPPACREEVIGDLYEASSSTRQYVLEAICVLPMVIFSRIRCTADPQVLLMHATALYMSFLGAARCEGKAFLFENSGLLRLAVPAAWVLFVLVLDDAYSVRGERSVIQKMRAPVLGLALAYLSQLAFSAGNGALSLPVRVMFFGSAVGLLLSIGLKFLFPSLIDRPIDAGDRPFG